MDKRFLWNDDRALRGVPWLHMQEQLLMHRDGHMIVDHGNCKFLKALGSDLQIGMFQISGLAISAPEKVYIAHVAALLSGARSQELGSAGFPK